MMRRLSSSVIARVAGAGVVGAVVGVTTLLGAGAASASVRNVTIPYSCNIPIFGLATLNIDVSVDIPDEATAGSPVQATNFSATAHIPHDVYDVFVPFGGTQADGTADVTAIVNLNGVDTTLPIAATIPLTQVPNPSGPDMLLPASGDVPVFTPAAPGTASVTAGDFTAHVTPKSADGNPTILGTLEVPCTVAGANSLGTVHVT